jgi:hypothetical protein
LTLSKDQKKISTLPHLVDLLHVRLPGADKLGVLVSQAVQLLPAPGKVFE